MNIINLIGTALGRGKQIHRLHFDWQYQTTAYKNAVQFANQNIDVIGVSECLERLNADYEEYKKQRDCLKNEEEQNEHDKYNVWERVYKSKFLIKWAVIAAFILCMFINPNRFFILRGLYWFLEFVFVVGSISFVALKIIEWRKRTEYQTYANNILRKMEDMNRLYLQKTDKIKLRIDDLYLASLDPAHREIVLMRRDQQRQHQEMLQMQKEYQRESLREQERTRLAQERMQDAQERTRLAQERLLAIEEERERRYNQW